MIGKVTVGSGNPAPVSSKANRMALATLPPTTASRSSMPVKRQYCCGIRNSSPANSSVTAPPPMNHSGCSNPPDGSAMNRARGVATAASAPSSRTLMKIRLILRGRGAEESDIVRSI